MRYNKLIGVVIYALCVIAILIGCKGKEASLPTGEYKACSFLVNRGDHYNIGIEIHTTNGNIKNLNTFTYEEFGELVTPLEFEDRETDRQHYCEESNSMRNCKKEWLTVSIREEDIEEVLTIMREHIFELNLVDPKGEHASIRESVTFDIVIVT